MQAALSRFQHFKVLQAVNSTKPLISAFQRFTGSQRRSCKLLLSCQPWAGSIGSGSPSLGEKTGEGSAPAWYDWAKGARRAQS